MTKILIWIIIFYFIYRFVRNVINALFLQNSTRKGNSDINGSDVYTNNGQQAQTKTHYNINRKDIVDAEFEEIKPEKPEEKDNKDKDSE
ncbi:MAG: hypothetical protein HF314_05200 [Ignavibacteria bacterium]|jgi:hypothetical protein|nr:hypothetical protein [Ignavibacteria bacterium]MCU7502447.1 hypothetical protein [Ignavibacteria bacterium]MCU7514988.1 hypothetical protein [Ignavibacteria bacterium]